MIAEIDAKLENGCSAGLFTAVALSVWRDGVPLLERGGDRTFDAASLTKVATAVATLQHLGPAHRLDWLGGVTTAELLSHASGLPAWRPLFAHAARQLGATPARLAAQPSDEVPRIYRELIATTPRESPRPTYSDLGFLALGLELESVTGRSLGELHREVIDAPIDGRGHAPTGTLRPRPGNPDVERPLVEAFTQEPSGDDAPDDDNAACAPLPSGHAGIFATAPTLARLGSRLLGDARDGAGGLLSKAAAQALFQRTAGTRTLGLDTPSGEQPAIGSVLGRGPLGAAGHLGFTGCSLWMDRDSGLSIALLTNAVLRARPAVALRAWRSELHDLVARDFVDLKRSG